MWSQDSLVPNDFVSSFLPNDHLVSLGGRAQSSQFIEIKRGRWFMGNLRALMGIQGWGIFGDQSFVLFIQVGPSIYTGSPGQEFYGNINEDDGAALLEFSTAKRISNFTTEALLTAMRDASQKSAVTFINAIFMIGYYLSRNDVQAEACKIPVNMKVLSFIDVKKNYRRVCRDPSNDDNDVGARKRNKPPDATEKGDGEDDGTCHA